MAESLQAKLFTAHDVAGAAADVAAERFAARTAARARLDARVANAAHDLDAARSELERLCESRRALQDGALWAEEAERDLPAHVDAVDGARQVLEARQADQREARAGLDRVLEQRTAASAAIHDADGQLDAIDGSGMDENGLRRELEAAGRAVRAAHDAHAAAISRVHALVVECEEAEQRSEVLRERLALEPSPDRVASAEVGRVRAALDSWTRAAQGVGPDPYAQSLADAFTDLLADLAELRQAAPVADDAAVLLAQTELDRAEGELERLCGAASPPLTPADRAELDEAHAAVDAAAERSGRRLAKASAQRRLDEARAAEQALLDRFGFSSHLEVLLTGGNAATRTPQRLAAERAVVSARVARDRLLRGQRSSPALDHLHSERARLLTHVVERLGVDPGEDVVALLRRHPALPGWVVDELRDALRAVAVHPIGVGLDEAALEFLQREGALGESPRPDVTERAQLTDELEAISLRADELALELVEARQIEEHAGEQLDLARRSVDAVEAELTVRAGEDTTRLKRFAAAEQLRCQVEALAATLCRAERDARSVFEQASDAEAAAEADFDRAQGVLRELSHRARSLAEALPTDRRPVGNRLSTLTALAEHLRERADALQSTVDEAQEGVTTASAKVDEACAAAEAAGTGAGPPRPEDAEDALVGLLAAHQDDAVVLDEPLALMDPVVRPRLLELIVGHGGTGSVVLLTEDADILGWAIGLPAHLASVTSADSLLNFTSGKAEATGAAPAAKSSARQRAGRH